LVSTTLTPSDFSAVGQTLLSNYTLPTDASGKIGTITPAALTVTGATAQNKVYDGKTAALFAGATLSGIIGSDAVKADVVSGNFKDKNVGLAKPVTVTAVTLTGADAGNYVVKPITVASSADISQRPVSNWTGAVSNLWSDPNNWDAIPDLTNVVSVVIPQGANPVVFDASMGNMDFDFIRSDSPLSVTGGALRLKTDLTASQFSQSGGSVSGGGAFKVNGSFSQTAGSIDMGSIEVTQSSGVINVNNLKAPTVNLTGASISQTATGGIETAALTTRSSGGTVLAGSGNRIGSWNAFNAGSGVLQLLNTGLISVTAANDAGDFIVESFGGVETKGQIRTSGAISITANSPLTIGVDGIVAGGGITLKATNLTSAGDITLNGPVHSNTGGVILSAANNMVQNAEVYGAMGVSADIGGTVAYGPNAKTGIPPVSYVVDGVQIAAPGVPPEATQGQANLVTTFLDKFEVALQNQNDQKRDKVRNDLVVEGEICRP
jgi:hypothetical protein